MDSNKSIDGLRTRDSRKSRISSTPSDTSSNSITHKPTTTHTTTKTTKAKKSTRTPKTNSAKSTSSVKSTKALTPIPTTRPQPKTSSTKASTKPNIKPNIKPDIAPAPKSDNNHSSTATNTPDTPLSSAEDFLAPTQVFNFDDQTGELKASDTPIDHHATKGKLKSKKVKKPVSKKRKIITTILLVVVLVLIAGVVWLVIWGNDIIAKITGGQGNIFDLITFTEPTYEPLKTDANGRTNILAFGTSGYNMEGDEGNGTHDGAQLTDSIMAISLNQETGDIAMISLPRDLKASPTCTATGKINEVYWCNNMDGEHEQEGATALMAEVGSILGMDFQYYAHLNWGSLVQIVDTLGGITVTLDEDIEDYYYTGAVFQAGQPYTIDGGQALGLARARHGTIGGDFSRGASQQKILIGIKDKVFEKQLSLTDLITLASTLGDNLRTNFNVEELKSFAHLASEFDFNNMRQISLLEPEPLMTTGMINGISYVLPAGGAGYYTKIQNYVAKMTSNNPSVYEDATILVLNGTETPGLAGTEKATLEEEGYDNIAIDDAPAGTYESRYTLYSLNDTKPGTKQALETKYSLEAKPATELPTGIPTDYDFVIIIGDTTTSTTTE